MATDVTDAVNAWKSSMGSTQTQEKYKRGIARTKVNPMAEAAKALPKYLRKVTEAVESGKMADRLLAANPQTWSQNAQGVGASRLKSGAEKGASKMQTHLAAFLPYVDSVKAQIDAMPDVTADDADQRMLRNAQLLRQYKRPSGQRYS